MLLGRASGEKQANAKINKECIHNYPLWTIKLEAL